MTQGELATAVAEVIRRHIPPEHAPALADPDANLTDLGLGSLALAGLVADIEATFRVEFTEDMLVPATFRMMRDVTAAVAMLNRH